MNFMTSSALLNIHPPCPELHPGGPREIGRWQDYSSGPARHRATRVHRGRGPGRRGFGHVTNIRADHPSLAARPAWSRTVRFAHGPTDAGLVAVRPTFVRRAHRHLDRLPRGATRTAPGGHELGCRVRPPLRRDDDRLDH